MESDGLVSRKRLHEELAGATLHVQSLRRQLEITERLRGPSGQIELLTCTVSRFTVGLPLATVVQVVLRARCHLVPNAPPYLLGSLDFHGTHIPVIDVHRRILGTEAEPQSRDVIVIVECYGRVAGLLMQDASAAWIVSDSDLNSLDQYCAFADFVIGCVTVQDRLGFLLSAAALSALPPDLEDYFDD